MELHRYIQVLFARWYDVVLLGLIGLAGTFAYLQWNAAHSAVTTVAVLEPSVSRALTGQGAQLTFAAVAESEKVKERVVNSLGLDIPTRDINVSVTLTRSFVPNIAAPLYKITVKHKDRGRALQIAAAVVRESRDTFVEMNTLPPGEVAEGLDSFEQTLLQKVASNRDALTQFQVDKRAWQLPSLIETHSTLLQAARRLASLRPLEGDYNKLQLELALATAAVTQGSSAKVSAALLGSSGAASLADAQYSKALERMRAAQAAVRAFEDTHGVDNLTADLNQQLDLRRAAQRQLALQEGFRLIRPDAGASQAPALDDQAALQTELDRLVALLPDYERLLADSAQSVSELTQFRNGRLQMRLNGSVSPGDFVRQLDPPAIASSFIIDLLFYTLGTLGGLVAGLLLVYLLAYFDRVPRSVEEVAELTGVPVLARIPDRRGS